MEGSNYWGYGYKTQHSYPRSRLIAWRRPGVKFGRNVVRRNNKKNPSRWGQKVRNKKLISQVNILYLLLISMFYELMYYSCSTYFPILCQPSIWSKMAPSQMLPLLFRVDLGVITTLECFRITQRPRTSTNGCNLVSYPRHLWSSRLRGGYEIHRLHLFWEVRLPTRVSCSYVGWSCRIHRLYLCWGVRLSQRVSCSPVDWGCRIHWLHLCRGIRLP